MANYFHNNAHGLSEEATLYKKELERYFKRSSDRYNRNDQIYAGNGGILLGHVPQSGFDAVFTIEPFTSLTP